jgi:hypothetical protein
LTSGTAGGILRVSFPTVPPLEGETDFPLNPVKEAETRAGKMRKRPGSRNEKPVNVVFLS